MTVHLEFPWTKRKRERELREMEEKRAACADQCNMQASEPYRPPHPCDHGHTYQPLAQTRTHIVRACSRCTTVHRIPLRVSKSPAPQRRWRPADLA